MKAILKVLTILFAIPGFILVCVQIYDWFENRPAIRASGDCWPLVLPPEEMEAIWRVDSSIQSAAQDSVPSHVDESTRLNIIESVVGGLKNYFPEKLDEILKYARLVCDITVENQGKNEIKGIELEIDASGYFLIDPPVGSGTTEAFSQRIAMGNLRPSKSGKCMLWLFRYGPLIPAISATYPEGVAPVEYPTSLRGFGAWFGLHSPAIVVVSAYSILLVFCLLLSYWYFIARPRRICTNSNCSDSQVERANADRT